MKMLLSQQVLSNNVIIKGINREGNGMARVQGFVIFLPDNKVVDQVKKARLNETMRNFAIVTLDETN